MEQPKELRRIYMASSALFSMAACTYGWLAPIGIVFGLVADMTEDKKDSNAKQLEDAVEKALERTRKSTVTDSQRSILDELSKIDAEPESLNKRIKKTEAYQTKYCTESDVKQIVKMFEQSFIDEISQSPSLSSLYVISTNIATLEKIKQINDILIKDDKKLDSIQNDVSAIKNTSTRMWDILVRFLNSVAFILIAMAIFLGIDIFSPFSYDKEVIKIAPICYAVSEFFIFFLSEQGYIFKSIFGEMKGEYYKSNSKNLKKLKDNYWKAFTSFIIPAFIALSCFWIINYAADIVEYNLIITSFGLATGSIISRLLKETQFEQRNIEQPQ